MAKKLFLKDFQKNVLVLNVSDERGVDIIRDKIKIFCQRNLSHLSLNRKLIVLDEADSLTIVAQEALRRIIENFSDKVRFALICNFPSKIIEPIQSRCAILRFHKISETFILYRLIFILNKEKIFFDIGGLETIIFLANGDIRQTLNKSQKISELHGDLTFKSVKKFCLLTDSTLSIDYFFAVCNKNFKFGKEVLFEYLNNGSNILEIIQNFFIFYQKIHKNKKTNFLCFYVLCNLKIIFTKEKGSSTLFSILSQGLYLNYNNLKIESFGELLNPKPRYN